MAQLQPGNRRLTSARAESTLRSGSMVTSPSAHLRSRGEHAAWSRASPCGSGSPPLARRARVDVGVVLLAERLTSARAESTPWTGT